MRTVTTPKFAVVGKTIVTGYQNPLPTIVKGKPVSVTPTPFTFTANIQNGSYSTSLLLPESERLSDNIIIFTVYPLRQAQEGQWDADTVLWQGDLWKVMKSKEFSMGVQDHYEVIAVRKQRIH